MGDIKITNLHEIHETEETKGKYQIFHTEEGRVYQSMVLYRKELEQLGDEIMKMLLSATIGGQQQEKEL
jgi:hypothetical protein